MGYTEQDYDLDKLYEAFLKLCSVYPISAMWPFTAARPERAVKFNFSFFKPIVSAVLVAQQ